MLVELWIISVVLLIIYPIPVFLLDILITLSIIFALAILIIVCRTGKSANLSLYPTILIFSTMFFLSINIASLRLILTKGADFDGVLIRFVSDLVAGHGIEVLVSGFLLFFALTAVQWFIIDEVKKQQEQHELIAEKYNARLDLTALLEKYMLKKGGMIQSMRKNLFL